MRPSFHVCLGCNETRITWQFAICTDCEEKYGRSALDWPDWLRESWNMEQRERRRIKKQKLYEIPLIELDYEQQDEE